MKHLYLVGESSLRRAQALLHPAKVHENFLHSS